MAAENIMEKLNVDRMIPNLFYPYTRDGKSGYGMYYTFELPIHYPEFSNRNPDDEVLRQRIGGMDDEDSTSER
ncbi:hypothetical protein V9T40_014686 [Parthenolecanium corni]|uniref:Uncharacterized protein n=1 Tax=Parthenolecanium corni TaxID=536013 RepID=A0AAN9T680_9HEMI